jgi:hypothetical protein
MGGAYLASHAGVRDSKKSYVVTNLNKCESSQWPLVYLGMCLVEGNSR